MLKKNQNKRWVPNNNWGVEKIYYSAHYLYQKNYKKLAYILKYINTLLFRVYIPPGVCIGQRLDLPHGGFGVVIF